uniref:Uncharacterized protein n=1 Tax=Wuchereria bancrofti TaxID=6293 RepID=A0A1I8ENH8_WUCBA
MEEVTNGSLNGLMDNHLTSVTVKLKIFLYQQNELNWLRAIINRQKAKIEELNEGRKMLFIELAQFKDIMLVDIYLVDIYSANNSYTEVLSTTY